MRDHLFTFVAIKWHAALGHAYENGQHFGFELEDGFDFILAQFDFEGLPELEGEGGVLLCVVA
ncbi:MAG: hypothetical protein EB121_06890, partial [Alphaproteobacteria bacterium]|nr:hypothetical protein [Alphaproteobacteria bacterium]